MSYLSTVLAFGLIYGILATGLNLQLGLTGIVNFGYVAFVAIGAYTTALLTTSHHWPLPLAWLAAMLLAGVASYPLGLLTIRLGGDYFAIVTLGFSELVALVILNERWLTRGSLGITSIAKPFGEFGPALASTLSLLSIAVLTTLTVVLAWRIAHSPIGRLLRAVQDNEAAAQALGKDTVGYKVLIMAIGSSIAGLAGALYAHWVQYISPDQFTPDVTFNTFIALILGGVGSLFGPIVGAFVLMLFLQGSIALQDYVHGVSAEQFAALRFMLVGLALVILIIFRPHGILGKRNLVGDTSTSDS